MRNTGKPSEEEFEEYFKSFGKRAYVHRFVDAAEIKGRTGKVGEARPAPADYLVTVDGETFYAEVKSTEHETRFAFSLLRTVQSAIAKQVLAAGGDYCLYIHSLHLNQWFKVPYSQVKSSPKKSLTWEELLPWRVTIARS
jgi:penicillin-binding protein-related factor A (putative recombinase)